MVRSQLIALALIGVGLLTSASDEAYSAPQSPVRRPRLHVLPATHLRRDIALQPVEQPNQDRPYDRDQGRHLVGDRVLLRLDRNVHPREPTRLIGSKRRSRWQTSGRVSWIATKLLPRWPFWAG